MLLEASLRPSPSPPPPLCSAYAETGCGYNRPLGDGAAGDYSEPDESDAEGGGAPGGRAWNVRQLGSHPETGEPLALRKGPYGLYVQAVSRR